MRLWGGCGEGMGRMWRECGEGGEGRHWACSILYSCLVQDVHILYGESLSPLLRLFRSKELLDLLLASGTCTLARLSIAYNVVACGLAEQRQPEAASAGVPGAQDKFVRGKV